MIEGFPADAMMPQLAVVWDPVQMLDIFRERLRPNGKGAVRIEGCRLSRFRYRRASRSIVLYELRLRAADSGRTWKQWVTGTTYPGQRARKHYKRLSREMQGVEIPPLWCPFRPVVYLSDLGLLLQVFPIDRYLPRLRELIAGPTPAMVRAMLGEFGPGDWAITDLSVEPTRYRPFLGVTLRYTVAAQEKDTGGCDRRLFYVKVYRDDEGAQAREVLQQIGEAADREDGRFEAVRAVGYFQETRALMLASAPGRSLEDILIAGDQVEQACRRVARGMASLHQAEVASCRHRDKEGMMARAHRAGAFIRWARPSEAKRVEKILDRLASQLAGVPLGPTHLDMKADHVFLDGGRVVFIDLDSFGLGDPVFDAATLVVRLEALADLIPVSRQTVTVAIDALLDEYFRHVPADWRARLGVNYACAALKVALYYVQHMERDWPRKVTALLDGAERALSGQAVPLR